MSKQDLATWQEFYGFDGHAQAFWFGFDLDRDTLKVSLKARGDAPLHAPGPAMPVKPRRDPAEVLKVSALPEVPCDYWGNKRSERELPGPFLSWE